MITISIDVLLLQKARFKEVTRRNGKKATFCELVLIETPNSEHGDFIVKQGVTKEERAARLEMPILGNGKIFQQGGNAQQRRNGPAPATAAAPQPTGEAPAPDDDVPF